MYIMLYPPYSSTYDHRVWRTGLPVRSAVLKPHAGRLVVGWVTTSESLLLYVFSFNFAFHVLLDTEIVGLASRKERRIINQNEFFGELYRLNLPAPIRWLEH